METWFLRSELPPEGQAKYWNNIPPTPVMDVPVPLEDFSLLKEVKALMECSPQHPVGREVSNTSLGARSYAYEDAYESSDDGNDGPLEEQMDVEDLLQELDGYSE